MAIGKWLDGYSGQGAEELIALAPEYRVDSIVLAFEEALLATTRELNEAESTVVLVEAYEREVNNGGHHQFFLNRPECAAGIGAALLRIGCPRTAAIAQEAVRMLGIRGEVTTEAVERALQAAGDDFSEALGTACDNSFYDGAEPIADHLFDYLKANAASLRLP